MFQTIMIVLIASLIYRTGIIIKVILAGDLAENMELFFENHEEDVKQTKLIF